MGIDASIALAGKAPQIENPLNYLLQAQQIQGAQNQNAMFPLMQQEQALKLIQAQRMNALIGNVLARRGMVSGGQPGQAMPNALAATSSAPGAAPNFLSAPPAQQPGIGGNDYEDLALAGYAPAEKAWNIHKEAQQGAKFDPGATYLVGGKQFTVPLLDKGMQMGPDGQVSALPGYAATNAGIQGAQTGATVGATNAATPPDTSLQMPDGHGGMMVVPGASKAAQLAYMQGREAPQASTPPAALPPMPPALQSKVDQLKTSGSPQEKEAFLQSATAAINGSAESPEMKQAGIAHLRDQLGLGTPVTSTPASLNHMTPEQKKAFFAQAEKQFGLRFASQQASTAAPGSPAPAFGGLATPADIEVGKQTKLSKVDLDKQAELDKLKLSNEPHLVYATEAVKGLQKKAEAVGGQLTESQNLLQRIEMSREALTKFKAGGGMGTGVELAQYAQALHMPDSLVNRLAGGDLAAAQEFQKFAAQEALGTMQQALASDSGTGSKGNKIAMELFIKNNPNITTDPNAIEKIFNFQTKLHNELLNKSDMLAKFVSDPSTVKDPIVFDNLYAKSQIKSGNVKPQIVQGQAKGTTPATPTNVQALLDKYK